jgi:hypothetical protein
MVDIKERAIFFLSNNLLTAVSRYQTYYLLESKRNAPTQYCNVPTSRVWYESKALQKAQK